MSDATQHNPATVHDTDQTAHPASDTAHPASTGPTYWRSLDELADTPEFRRYLDSEFPGYDPQTIL
ncbi:MAG: TAT-variant-translocated molybdopterin oxidoreductase, partial [Alphaproteobacteria bacterium]|nr:TAT-variant-translocated molybdopterin oxidoreductase [Alphaproteobacteria bacterium]